MPFERSFILKNENVTEDSILVCYEVEKAQFSLPSCKSLEGGGRISSLLWRHVKYQFPMLLWGWDWNLTLPINGALLGSKALTWPREHWEGECE